MKTTISRLCAARFDFITKPAVLGILKFIVPAALAFSLTTGPALANQTTVYPDQNTPDTADPVGVQNDSAPGFPSGSFQANGNAKTAIYLDASTLFGSSPVTIGDLNSFSYWTKQNVPDTGTPVNWYVEIYTVAKNDGTDDGFYHRRLNFEPYFSQNRNESDDTWTQWSTNGVGQSDENKLRVFDANRGKSADVYGTYTDPFLSDLTNGPINWSDYSSAYEDAQYDYRNDQISFIGISTGSEWANGFDGQLDGFQINWGDGNTSSANFEAASVPEPGALGIFGFGLLMLGLAFRRKQSRR